MSRLLAIFLALAVAVTSQAFALARGQSAAVGEMVICAGGGFVTVAVDAMGEPVGTAHLCPDAVVALGETLSPPVVAPRAAPVVAVVAMVTARRAYPVARAAGWQARGPPVPV